MKQHSGFVTGQSGQSVTQVPAKGPTNKRVEERNHHPEFPQSPLPRKTPQHVQPCRPSTTTFLLSKPSPFRPHCPLSEPTMTNPSPASLSLALRHGEGFTVSSPPQGLRHLILTGVAVASGLALLLRRAPGDAVRRRVIRKLDRIAPRKRYEAAVSESNIINTDCPVCLCEFASSSERVVRVLPCRHALCATCLEAWAVHCTKAHLNPARFGITRAGQVVSWTPGPKCPLCCARMNCVPDEDLREAIIAVIHQRGAALSTFIAYQARSSSGVHEVGDQDEFGGNFVAS